METNRRIRPRNEFVPSQGGGGVGTSSSSTSSTTRKSVLETSTSTTTTVSATALGHKKSNITEEDLNTNQPKNQSSDHQHDHHNHNNNNNNNNQPTVDAELLLLSTIMGMKDKESQYLYEKCGDSIISCKRYYDFVINKKLQLSSSSSSLNEQMMTSMKNDQDTKPEAITEEVIFKTQKDMSNYVPTYEQHNVALLQFLSSSSSSSSSSLNSQSAAVDPSNETLNSSSASSFSNMHFNQILQKFHQNHCSNRQQDYSPTSTSTTYLCESSLKRLQSLIAGYNLGLLTLCQGNDPKMATTLLASYFFSYLEQEILQDSNSLQESLEKDDEDDENNEKQEQVILNQAIRNVQSQIAFALLDGIIACMIGFTSHIRKQQEYFNISTMVETQDNITSQSGNYLTTVELIQRVVTWLEMYIQSMVSAEIRSSHIAANIDEDGLSYSSNSNLVSSSATSLFYSYTQDSSSELKFRLMCYKSRLWFVLGTNTFHSKGNHNASLSTSGKNTIMSRYSDFDEVTRAARKELKNAIEIFHHKLESEVKVTSVVSSDLQVVENTITFANKTKSTIKSNSDALPHHRRSHLISEEGVVDKSIGRLPFQNLSLKESLSNVNSDEKTAERTISSWDDDLLQNHLLDLLSKYRMNKLQSQHQNALYLKAYLEFLKSNMKKSLKLCSEALNGNDREGVDSTAWMESELSTLNGIPKEQDANNTLLFFNPRREATPDIAQQVTNYEAAVFNNNLGLIHQSSGKLHLALHYYARALAELERMEQNQTTMNGLLLGFEPHLGTANALQLTTSQVLINTAICAQQARNFVTGYECMARCVMACQALFYDRPWFWLNMAENCVGIHVELSGTGKSVESRLTVEMQVLIDKASSMPVNEDGSIVLLGSEYDISFVKRYPLTRALFCLNTCIWLTNVSSAGSHGVNEEDENCVESARLVLAYVWLELNNPASALKEADAVIHAPNNRPFKYERDRRLAIAQVYADDAKASLL